MSNYELLYQLLLLNYHIKMISKTAKEWDFDTSLQHITRSWILYDNLGNSIKLEKSLDNL